MKAKQHAEDLARELTLAVADRLGVDLTADQAIALYRSFRDGIAAAVGDLLDDMAACGELGETNAIG